ncbi:DegT/DnrJ/EryC1/StrS family aminotransferase [Methanoregula formicica]|uniref:Putative PLP-dependent enzyme possibly involved in cell wall biogenesis n=1 Tax=Methanoregula formicica (strain DSM 22288 / NBRC 105244 / SMSP) TaxID=593750 RepID=L0HH95_METFS|nr:DegT/DnrJ/EryC1/StrS family aminotransferase [Methanoregula formicica]AGB02454.1 putative PLP-dependent enzyme possibly involved in cell wall biogenesis [Methanoregula formicica SMSP]
MTRIPIAKPEAGEEEIRAVSDVLRSGMFAQGPVVRQFENEFAALCGTRHAVAVNNGTAALHAALASAGIGPGDEVIVPTFSFFATASCVSMCGARPVFVDVDERMFGIDPACVNNAITAKTKAVIGVHLFGQPFDVQPVRDICDDHNLLLIEDAAQAHGALYRKKPVGSMGHAGCFSFYPTKNMTTGEGGIITTNDDEYAAVLRRFTNHGQSDKYYHTMIGYNYRMTDIGAAIGREQLKKLPEFNARRRANAEYLSAHIHAPGIVTPFCMPVATHVYHQYVLRVIPSCPLSRSELITMLAAKGIGSAIHYPIPIHRQPVYLSQNPEVSCPIAERLAQEVVSLPVHPNVTEPMLDEICDAINSVS